MIHSLIKKRLVTDAGQAKTFDRLIKGIITAALCDHGTKIVFGEPCEPGWKKLETVRYSEPKHSIEDEDIALFTGSNVEEVTEDRLKRESEIKVELGDYGLPMWIKIREGYYECAPLPKVIFLDMILTMRDWNKKQIPWDQENPRWEEIKNLPPQETVKNTLSNFLLRLEDGRIIHASLGFEQSFCLSISIRDTGKTVSAP